MHFNLIKNPIIFNYSIFNYNLKLVSNFMDLALILWILRFDSKLNLNKTMRFLGFIKRSCKDFCDPFALKILYYSLIRSNFDYWPLIWIKKYLNKIIILKLYKITFYTLCLSNITYVGYHMVHLIIF
jgi:hypothetical protein